ncbi:sensor domain-containing diguanylate cyclase [Deinococcus radiotolerans]|uniref:Diguanylate cyclase n=1 Tax=Deinococcus radiotolerans TaxID=1309407 RepID=A0ABQ2FJK7_9DEIO|nr:CHASE2 domain-containing protein [Deinococcus radiotolerans]GGK98627.1 diguanylate cyclase [Deinococcus radiotolerans]
MARSAERSLALITAPVAASLAALLALAAPQNPRLQDALNRALPAATDRRVVLVGIDDASLRDYGNVSSWPPDLYRQALGTLEQAGAAAIGVDLLPPSTPDRAPLNGTAQASNVVLATQPGEAAPPQTPGRRATTGISALNVSPDGVVRSYQTAYPGPDGTLTPSFAWQLAAAAGRRVDLSTQPRPLRYAAPDPDRLPVIPFRDVVNGNVRYGDIQGRVVLIGLTASGAGGQTVRDVSGQPVMGAEVQVRAVSSLLSTPITVLPTWLTALLSILMAVGAVFARGLWGFALATVALLAAAPLWLLSVLLPGVTLSLAAIIGTALVALERWWNLRSLALRDPLTGFGNRLAFTRALEQRWATRHARPLGLLLVDLSGFRKVNELYGAHAGDELLRDLSGRVLRQKRRGDLFFRWGPDEFAVLLDQASAQEIAELAQRVQDSLDQLQYRDLPLRASVGAARTGDDVHTPTDLVEAASRSRYRVKYQREQRG